MIYSNQKCEVTQLEWTWVWQAGQHNIASLQLGSLTGLPPGGNKMINTPGFVFFLTRLWPNGECVGLKNQGPFPAPGSNPTWSRIDLGPVRSPDLHLALSILADKKKKQICFWIMMVILLKWWLYCSNDGSWKPFLLHQKHLLWSESKRYCPLTGFQLGFVQMSEKLS